MISTISLYQIPEKECAYKVQGLALDSPNVRRNITKNASEALNAFDKIAKRPYSNYDYGRGVNVNYQLCTNCIAAVLSNRDIRDLSNISPYRILVRDSPEIYREILLQIYYKFGYSDAVREAKKNTEHEFAHLNKAREFNYFPALGLQVLPGGGGITPCAFPTPLFTIRDLNTYLNNVYKIVSAPQNYLSQGDQNQLKAIEAIRNGGSVLINSYAEEALQDLKLKDF